jgi:4-hydroxy-tetrahydrodipicolinate synthase
MTRFEGIQVAAITPRGKQGDVDLGAAFELIDYLCAAGSRGIVLFSDSGEYPAFTAEERSRLLYLSVKRSRVPVWAGVGSANLEASLALGREARDAGAAALLVPPPFFFRYDADDVREFYLEFARHIGNGAVVFLSNSPGSASPIPAATAIELLETGCFAGIEESRGALESVNQLRAAVENRPWQVLTGDDAIFTRARCLGVRCAISSAACAVPELLVALDRAIGSANRGQVDALNAALAEFLAWNERFPPPTIVKVATGLRGLKTGPVPAPLSPAKQKLLDEFREWFRGWLPAVKRLCGRA